ncbi:hypothetical protein AJ78_06537 [Emergomyces pasteurianus Ep9510]|uniref:Ig-like domain-containing protein n=1 Tax=Emergomyces pasteurianus Ep9510 TaxID=1447872 RepID=A0A1J9QCQ5_9EURO|nr:hypothetical protein AJ78_06537 [Emergomyces pasteurianus Ep9510]
MVVELNKKTQTMLQTMGKSSGFKSLPVNFTIELESSGNASDARSMGITNSAQDEIHQTSNPTAPIVTANTQNEVYSVRHAQTEKPLTCLASNLRSLSIRWRKNRDEEAGLEGKPNNNTSNTVLDHDH